jgi:hypothetical protein
MVTINLTILSFNGEYNDTEISVSGSVLPCSEDRLSDKMLLGRNRHEKGVQLGSKSHVHIDQHALATFVKDVFKRKRETRNSVRRSLTMLHQLMRLSRIE